MKFSDALELMKNGEKIRVKGNSGYHFIKFNSKTNKMDIYYHTKHGIDYATNLSNKEILTDEWELFKN